jgi:hypothetical protein
MPFSHLAAVFIEVDITDPMETVFDVPVSTIESQQPLGASLLGSEVGDAEDTFGAGLARLDLEGPPFDLADLAHIREIEKGIERCGGAKSTLLDPPVALVHGGVLRGGKRPNRRP